MAKQPLSTSIGRDASHVPIPGLIPTTHGQVMTAAIAAIPDGAATILTSLITAWPSDPDRRPEIQFFSIRNNGASPIYIGDSTVTADTGFIVPAMVGTTPGTLSLRADPTLVYIFQSSGAPYSDATFQAVGRLA